uniref:Uncharacterized protein n=1 Tax=Oryza rufipogon TaxID=4529 RepID=A0A0E0MVV7_ORYRU
MKIKAKISGGVSKRQCGPRRSIPRDHVGAHQRLVEDYFAPESLYPERLCYAMVNAAGMLANGRDADELGSVAGLGRALEEEGMEHHTTRGAKDLMQDGHGSSERY